ncbi:hypothetical protein LOAG_09588 [Loa loa]|uniref:Uncharacterized protein n=1 Tax=Loa loa TaxID=7209 RepID=A0A1S0TS58_LOALO|nr:hypothetical protein LOAG_09588 [Loa loa]EFO18905.1 hypothetical protein LOAG_09588 [Loa loa]
MRSFVKNDVAEKMALCHYLIESLASTLVMFGKFCRSSKLGSSLIPHRTVGRVYLLRAEKRFRRKWSFQNHVFDFQQLRLNQFLNRQNNLIYMGKYGKSLDE